jgi:hypothetical protein
MPMRYLIFALPLALAACGGNTPGNADADHAAVAAVAAAPVPTNFALGRWLRDRGDCVEIEDIQFTATAVTLTRSGALPHDIPIRYGKLTADTVEVGVVGDSGGTMLLTRKDPTQMVLTAASRPGKQCVLVRK